MRTWLVGLVGIIGLSFTVSAAAQVGQNRPGGRIIQRLNRALDLTPQQETQLRDLLSRQQSQIQPLADQVRSKAGTLRILMQQSNPDPTAVGRATLELKTLRAQVKELRGRLLTELKAILRQDQIDKLDRLKGQRLPGILRRGPKGQ